MNQRFLRWVLDVTHKAVKGRGFGPVEWVARWNGLICSVAFSLFFLGIMFTEPLLNVIFLGGFTVYFWFVCLNAWFFHKMRREKMLKRAKQRTRWMLNATPYCFFGMVLVSAAFLSISEWSDNSPLELKLICLILGLVLPYFFTRVWIVIATIPFHSGYGRQ